MKFLGIYLVIINVVAFFTMGLDKWKAKKDRWRIPEKVLLGLALVGGSFGALMGMHLFLHKTKHMKFVIGLPVIFTIHMALLAFLVLR